MSQKKKKMEDEENIDSLDDSIPKINRIKKYIGLLLSVFIVIFVIVCVLLYKLFHELPNNDTIRNFKPRSTASAIY